MNALRLLCQKALRGLAGLIYAWPRTIALAFFVLTLATAYVTIFHLGVVNNANDLIRKDSEAMSHFLDYVREFNAKEPMVVVIRSEDFEKNRQAADALAPVFKARIGEIHEVYYRNDLSKLRPHFLLYEDEAKLKQIVEQIRTQGGLLKGKGSKGVNLNSLLDEALAKFDRVDRTQGKEGSLDELGVFADRMVRDLEKLARELDRPLNASQPKEAQAPESVQELDRQLLLNSYLSFEEGKMLLMILTPVEIDRDGFSPMQKTIDFIREEIAKVQKNFPDVSIGLTGEPVLMADELKQSTDDMIKGSIIAFVFIVILFAVSYHEIVRPAFGIIALLGALFWSLAFAVLTVGHLNIISQAFVLMLLGIGVDFGIQILGRYEEEWLKGKNVLHALENTLQFTGLAVIVGGGTTALAFYSMCFNEFLGLAELGLIAGSGMVFAVLANLIFLPALLIWRDKKRSVETARHSMGHIDRGARFDKWLFSAPKTALLIGTFLTVAMGAAAWYRGVPFDYNLLNLQSQSLESVKLARHLATSDTSNFIFGVIVAQNLEEAKQKTAQLEKLPTVGSVMSPAKMLPANQEAKLEILKQIRAELSKIAIRVDRSGRIDVARAKANLAKLLEYSRTGYKEASKYRQVNDRRAQLAIRIFEQLIPSLEESLASLSRLSASEAERRLNRYQIDLLGKIQQEFEFLKSFDLENPVTLEDLPPEAFKHYISPSGKILIEVIPRENIWEREANQRFVDDLRRVSPHATGTPVQNDVYIHLLIRSYIEAAWYALATIIVALALHFHRFWRVVLALAPVLIAIIWTLGTMALLGMPFNPANIITLPLVIGIGVAYGIYVVDRYVEEGENKVFSSSTGKAVLLSAMTAISGFLVMIIGHYPGLVSLGKLMSLSIFYCFVAGTFIIPQILVLLGRKKRDPSLSI